VSSDGRARRPADRQGQGLSNAAPRRPRRRMRPKFDRPGDDIARRRPTTCRATPRGSGIRPADGTHDITTWYPNRDDTRGVGLISTCKDQQIGHSRQGFSLDIQVGLGTTHHAGCIKSGCGLGRGAIIEAGSLGRRRGRDPLANNSRWPEGTVVGSAATALAVEGSRNCCRGLPTSAEGATPAPGLDGLERPLCP